MDHKRKKGRTPSGDSGTAAPEVHYTPPAPLNGKKLALQITSVVAVALAVFLGLSVFFRVEYVNVSGNEKYDAWTIRQASGIQQGESLLSFGKARAAGRITHALPYVKTVRLGISLPNTVNIHIEEIQVVYAACDQQNGWWLMTSEGKLVERVDQAEAEKHTALKGFVLTQPKVGQQAKAAEPNEVDENGDPVVVTVTNAQRLAAALKIAQQLELNQILGQAASVNVEKMGAIELWYGKQYQVKLGNAEGLEGKIAAMAQGISQMSDHQSGVLDVTFEKDSSIHYFPF